jgi:hypothetical protein
MTYKRDYKQEYANYDGTEAVKKKRAQRNKARRMLEREGVVSKGDGQEANQQGRYHNTFQSKSCAS